MNGLLYLLPGALLGAVASYLLPVIIGLPRYIWRFYVKDTAAEGNWYSYHCTRKDGAAHVRSTYWKIKKNLHGEFSARCYARLPNGRLHLQGKGAAIREFGFLVITAKSKSYNGHWTIRILDPLVPEETFYPGLWLSFDFDHKLIAGPIIFSQKPMAEADAKSLLRSQISVLNADRQLRVVRSPKGVWPPVGGSQP